METSNKLDSILNTGLAIVAIWASLLTIQAITSNHSVYKQVAMKSNQNTQVMVRGVK